MSRGLTFPVHRPNIVWILVEICSTWVAHFPSEVRCWKHPRYFVHEFSLYVSYLNNSFVNRRRFWSIGNYSNSFIEPNSLFCSELQWKQNIVDLNMFNVLTHLSLSWNVMLQPLTDMPFLFIWWDTITVHRSLTQYSRNLSGATLQRAVDMNPRFALRILFL